MALDAGTRVGPYEIVAPIGAGGMGEVYRARDGQRFLFIQPGISRQAAPQQLKVIVNWTSGAAQ